MNVRMKIDSVPAEWSAENSIGLSRIPDVWECVVPKIVAARKHEATGAWLAIWAHGQTGILVWYSNRFSGVLPVVVREFGEFDMLDDNLAVLISEGEAALEAGPPDEIIQEIAKCTADDAGREKAEFEQYKKAVEEHKRSEHLNDACTLWRAPSPSEALALIFCDDSEHREQDPLGRHSTPYFYWIAVRFTEDYKQFEIVRVDDYGRIVQHYDGPYDDLDQAVYEARTLAKIWDAPRVGHLARLAAEERDLTPALKNNRWARAVYQRKHPSGPVLVVWHLEPLALYVAGWIPFAGGRCIPSLVSFVYEADPARESAAIEDLANDVFGPGPSANMIDHSRSIAAKYAANGAKGGRPKKDAYRSKDK